MTHPYQSNISTPINHKRGFRIHLLAYLFGIPAAWLVWSLTDRTYPWALWQTIGWTIGIVFHYLGVYVFKKSKQN